MVKESMRVLEVACLLWGGLVSFAADGDEAKVLWTGKDDAADAVEVTCDTGVELKTTDGKTVVEFAADAGKWQTRQPSSLRPMRASGLACSSARGTGASGT